MNFRTTIAAGLLAVLGATSAHAATFNFAAIADDFWTDASTNAPKGTTTERYEPTWAQIKYFDVNDNGNDYFVDGGVELVNVMATYNPPNGQAPADGFFDSGNAGLGVCHSDATSYTSPHGGNISNCSTNFGNATSDDNVTFNEAMTLVFDKAVSVTNLLFRNADHYLANGTILINGTQYTVASGVIASLPTGSMTSWSFAYDDANNGSGATQFYLSSMSVAPVPVPASILLLGGALAGFGAMRRRQQRKA